MRILSRLFCSLLLIALAVPAAAAGFSTSGDRITLATAGISFPKQIASLTFREAGEFSNKGEGIDNVAQYQSADAKVFATVYAYYSAFSHSGLTAYATGRTLETASPGLRKLDSRLAAAGGIPDAAIREIYSGYRDNLASGAAFVKVGRWIIKLRVSGPETRAAEVTAALDALLSGVSFGAQKPRRAEPLKVAGCSADGPPAAMLVPDDAGSIGAELLILTTMDGGDLVATDKSGGKDLVLDGMTDSFCEVPAGTGPAGDVWMIRADGKRPDTGFFPNTEAIAILNDAGSIVEVVTIGKEKRHRVIYYQIGSTTLLGSFEAEPSIDQLRAIIAGTDKQGSAARGKATFRPDKGDQVHIFTPAPDPKSPTS